MAGFSFPTRVNTSTLNAWLKKIEEPIYRDNPLMAVMKKRGLIKYKAGEIGSKVSWPVRFDRRDLREIEGATTDRTFVGRNTKLHASCEWAGYDMTERISKLERLVNSNSQTQIFNLVKTTLSEMMEDFLEALGLLMWQDGTVTGTGLQGILSLYGGSSTITADKCYNGIGTYTPITPSDGVSAWWACAMTKTYAGLLETLGNKVNSWTGDTSEAWPKGQFPAGYSYWHPLVCDYNSSYFGGTATNWDYQWQQAFNAVTTYQTKLHRIPVDLWILDADLMRRAKDSLISSERFIVTDSSETRSLGFKALEYNGWEILTGYGVPDGMGVGFTFDKMELRLLQNQLVEKSEDSDIRTSEDLYLLDSYHQLVFKSPAWFPALVPASTAGT